MILSRYPAPRQAQHQRDGEGGGDHLGMNGIRTSEQLAAVKSVVVQNVATTGFAVLNAADPLTAAMAEKCPGTVIYFAHDGRHPTIVEHRAPQLHHAVAHDDATDHRIRLHETASSRGNLDRSRHERRIGRGCHAINPFPAPRASTSIRSSHLRGRCQESKYRRERATRQSLLPLPAL